MPRRIKPKSGAEGFGKDIQASGIIENTQQTVNMIILTSLSINQTQREDISNFPISIRSKFVL